LVKQQIGALRVAIEAKKQKKQTAMGGDDCIYV